MKIDFEIGEALVAPEYVNTFKLTLEYMHGDADGDTSKEFYYTADQVDELKFDLMGLISLDDFDADAAQQFYEGLGFTDEDQGETWRDNFVEYDITCEGNDAALSRYTVTFFDANSVEHEVHMIINEQDE